MTIIFDLDYTLLDTEAFKEALIAEFAACGVDRETFLASYDRVTRPDGAWECNYRPDAHIEELAGSLACSPEDLRARIDDVVSRTHEFLYAGAKKLLDDARRNGHRLVLLTLGNAEWQRRKVTASGIESMFDEIRVTEKGKEGIIAELASGGPATVINDNGKEIMRMRDAAPDLTYVMKKGPKGVPDGFPKDIPICSTLEEVEGILLKG